MKNIYLIVAAILLFTNCKAQTPVKSLSTDSKDIWGAYYKDTYNDLDRYVGTWKYTNGLTSLTITLQKKTMQHYEDDYDSYYEDVLIGEYKYIENGVEKVNTLPLLVGNSTNTYKHNISGNILVGPQSQYCLGCGAMDRKVVVGFMDPNRDIMGFEPEMIFQRADAGSVQKLKLNFRTTSGQITIEGQTPAFTSYTVPFGEYLLVKQH